MLKVVKLRSDQTGSLTQFYGAQKLNSKTH